MAHCRMSRRTRRSAGQANGMSSSTHQETETKFEGCPRQPLSAQGLPGVDQVTAAETDVLDAVYYDTEGLSLLGHGITLRRREGGADAGWHLKVPASDGSRTESQLPLGPEGSALPLELVRRACVYARGAQLRPSAHLRTHRTRTLLKDAQGRTLAEVAVDEVAARALDPVTDRATATAAGATTAEPQTELTSWTETEVELVDVPPGEDGKVLLDAVAQQLAAQGVLPSRSGSKLAHALGAPMPALHLLRTDVSSAGVTAQALVGALRRHTDALLALDQAVRADEPDAVHQMRTTARRLRSLLKIQRRLGDRSVLDPLADELRWLGQVLGTHRDPQTLGERLVAQAHDLPAPTDPSATASHIRAWADKECAVARKGLLRTLDSERYFTLIDSLERTAAQPRLRPGRQFGKKAARKLLRHEVRRVGRRADEARALSQGPARDRPLHQTRKASKRARYGAEALADILDKAGRVSHGYKKAQKHLGRHQDAVAAEQVLAELSCGRRTTSADAFAYGILFAVQRRDTEADVAAAWRATRKVGKV